MKKFSLIFIIYISLNVITLMSAHSNVKPKNVNTPNLTGQKHEAEKGKLVGCEIAEELGVRYVNGIIENDYIEWENIKGVRITPNVYTTTKNLDILVEGIEKFAKT